MASKRLSEMNPEVILEVYPVNISKNNAIAILSAYDFIIDGTDNFESRYLINDACTLLKKPSIFAAVSAYEGQLAIFNVANERHPATNYRDLFPIQPKQGEISNCAENGVLGVLPGIIGTMAATETIKLITGVGKPLINKLLQYNLLTNQHYEMSISPAQDYTLPKTENELLKMEYQNSGELSQSYSEIDAAQMQALQEKDSTLFIDVRERHEVPSLNQAIFTQIPMSEFDQFLKTTIQAENIVLLCQHGIRSVVAAELLHDKYGDTKNIFSLKGGIVKWRNYFLVDKDER